MVLHRFSWGVNGALFTSGIRFTPDVLLFFDPFGRYGRIDGVTALSKYEPPVTLSQYTIKLTLSDIRIEQKN